MTALRVAVAGMVLGIANPAGAQQGPPPTTLSYPPPSSQATLVGRPNYGGPRAEGPMTLKYDSSAPPPPGYRLDENPRKWMLVTGALTFGVPYLISLTVGGASTSTADRWLLLPVMGPVGTLSARQSHCDRDKGSDCAADILTVVGLAFDLAGQSAGALVFTLGFVFPKKEWVRDIDFGRASAPAVTWTIVPRFDARTMGLTLAGTIN